MYTNTLLIQRFVPPSVSNPLFTTGQEDVKNQWMRSQRKSRDSGSKTSAHAYSRPKHVGTYGMEHGVRECRKLLEALNRNGENIFHQKLGPKRLKDVLELKKSKGDRHVTMKDLIGIRGISSKTLGNMTSSSTHVTRIIETCQYYESIYGEVKTVNSAVVIK